MFDDKTSEVPRPLSLHHFISWCVVDYWSHHAEQAYTRYNTPCTGVPGPKLNPRKIFLLILLTRFLITAVLRRIREGKEQERQGANRMWKQQEEKRM